MIRALTQRDYDAARLYLGRDPLNNVYLIDGLQTYGFDSEQATFWGAFDNDRLDGILFVNDDGRHRIAYLAGDNPEVLARLGRHALKCDVDTLFGKSNCIEPAANVIEDLAPQVEIQRTRGHLSVTPHPGQLVGRYDHPVRKATRDDIPSLVAFYSSDELKGYSGKRPEKLERDIQRAVDRSACLFVESEGRVVSATRIDPETDQAGVIELSATLPEFRGRGMYSSVRTACVEYLSSKGKVAIGVTADSNIAVHKVVEKMVGSFIEPWLYVRIKKKYPLIQRILPGRLRRWASKVKGWVLRRNPRHFG